MPLYIISANDNCNFELHFIVDDVSADEAIDRLPYGIAAEDCCELPDAVKGLLAIEEGDMVRVVIQSRSSVPNQASNDLQ